MGGNRHRCGEETRLTCPTFHLHFSLQEKREPSAQVPNTRSSQPPVQCGSLCPGRCVYPWLTDPSIGVGFHPPFLGVAPDLLA